MQPKDLKDYRKKIKQYLRASTDPKFARKLAKEGGLDKYSIKAVQEHYQKTARTIETLLTYVTKQGL